MIIRTIRKSHPQSVLFSFVITCCCLCHEDLWLSLNDVQEVRISDENYMTVLEEYPSSFVITAVGIYVCSSGPKNRWTIIPMDFFLYQYSSSDISFVILWDYLVSRNNQGAMDICVQWKYIS